MDFLELANKRYSCRKFSDKAVESEKAEKILEGALCAPTAVNKQPYKIWVVKSQEVIDKLSEVTRFTFDAKLFFIVGYKEEEAWVRKYDNRNFADVDASIVSTQLMLEVADLGLGTTWVGHFDAPKLKEICPSLDGYELIAIFPVGYPASDAEPSSSHEIKRDRDEMVSYL